MAQFTNQAQLAYNDSVINSNIAVGEILEVLSVTKTAVGDDYGADSNLTYVISVVNSGATPFNALTLTDDPIDEFPKWLNRTVFLAPHGRLVLKLLAKLW